MIDHQRKLLFVHITRTGGTSIEKSLIREDWWKIDPRTKHLSASQTHRHYGDRLWREYTTFAVVRNPWDRFVSMWSIGYWYSPDTHLKGVKPANFKEFLRTLRPHPAEVYNTLHQTQILDEPVDYILRYETLQQDFSGMLKQRDLEDMTLPVALKSERKPYREYYDSETEEQIGRIYAADIRCYKYSF